MREEAAVTMPADDERNRSGQTGMNCPIYPHMPYPTEFRQGKLQAFGSSSP
jgi:hypothetical protein